MISEKILSALHLNHTECLFCYYAEYAECRYDGCHAAECRGTVMTFVTEPD
jgi:hypothetical protein